MISENKLLALIEHVEGKLHTFKQLYDESQEYIGQLERERNALQTSLSEQQNRVIELEEKCSKLEKNTSNSKDSGIIVKDNLSGTDTNAELKQQLDGYIRELERCIAHLGSLS